MICWELLRRKYISKIHNTNFQIVGLIASAQEYSSGNPQVVAVLDKVIEALRSTELYTPVMRDDYRVQTGEPVATDLIGALLAVSFILNFLLTLLNI